MDSSSHSPTAPAGSHGWTLDGASALCLGTVPMGNAADCFWKDTGSGVTEPEGRVSPEPLREVGEPACWVIHVLL